MVEGKIGRGGILVVSGVASTIMGIGLEGVLAESSSTNLTLFEDDEEVFPFFLLGQALPQSFQLLRCHTYLLTRYMGSSPRKRAKA